MSNLSESFIHVECLSELVFGGVGFYRFGSVACVTTSSQFDSDRDATTILEAETQSEGRLGIAKLVITN